MAWSDIALQALLNYKADRQARTLARYESLPQILPSAIQTGIQLSEASRKQDLLDREAAARYGTPAGVRVPLFGGSARPGETRVTPGRVGGAMAAADLPEELLTGRARRALSRGGDVFYTPGTIGQDEFKMRAGLLDQIEPANVIELLTEPDRSKALAGAMPRVKTGKTTMIPTSDKGMQDLAKKYGVDLTGIDYIPVSTLNTVIRESGRQKALQDRSKAMTTIKSKASLVDLNRLGDDLRQKLQDDANYIIRLSDDERAYTQDMLSAVIDRQLELLKLQEKRGKEGGSGTGGIPKFATEAEAEKAARSGRIKRGDKISVGGKVGYWE